MKLNALNLKKISSQYSEDEFKDNLFTLAAFTSPDLKDNFISIKVCFSTGFEIDVNLVNIIRENLDIQHSMIDELKRIKQFTQGKVNEFCTFLLNMFVFNLNYVTNIKVIQLRHIA